MRIPSLKIAEDFAKKRVPKSHDGKEVRMTSEEFRNVLAEAHFSGQDDGKKIVRGFAAKAKANALLAAEVRP